MFDWIKGKISKWEPYEWALATISLGILIIVAICIISSFVTNGLWAGLMVTGISLMVCGGFVLLVLF